MKLCWVLKKTNAFLVLRNVFYDRSGVIGFYIFFFVISLITKASIIFSCTESWKIKLTEIATNMKRQLFERKDF